MHWMVGWLLAGAIANSFRFEMKHLGIAFFFPLVGLVAHFVNSSFRSKGCRVPPIVGGYLLVCGPSNRLGGRRWSHSSKNILRAPASFARAAFFEHSPSVGRVSLGSGSGCGEGRTILPVRWEDI